MSIYLKIKRFIGWGLKEFKMFLNPIEIKFYNHWKTVLTEKLPHKLWFYRLIKSRNIGKKNNVFFSRWVSLVYKVF